MLLEIAQIQITKIDIDSIITATGCVPELLFSRMTAFLNHYIRNSISFCFGNYGASLLASNYLLKENIVFEQSSTNVEITIIKECSLYQISPQY